MTSDLKAVADADRRTRDFSRQCDPRALIEIIARFPTYRSYLRAISTRAMSRTRIPSHRDGREEGQALERAAGPVRA